MSATAKSVCFTVTGEFITQQARTFWADDDEPEKALKLLKTLDGISDQQCLDVVEGRTKLVGDSNVGVSIVSEISPPKLPTLQETLNRLKRERDDAREDAADLTAMLNGDTVGVPSSTGLRQVPTRQTVRSSRGARLRDGLDWEGCADPEKGDREPRVWCETESSRRMQERSGRAKRIILNRIAEDEEEEEDLTPPPFTLEISSDTGWLAPDGKFYACSYGDHNEIARRLGFDGWGLDKSGWIKAAGEEHGFFLPDGGTTVAQAAAIRAFCTKEKREVPWWLDRAKTEDT